LTDKLISFEERYNKKIDEQINLIEDKMVQLNKKFKVKEIENEKESVRKDDLKNFVSYQ